MNGQTYKVLCLGVNKDASAMHFSWMKLYSSSFSWSSHHVWAKGWCCSSREKCWCGYHLALVKWQLGGKGKTEQRKGKEVIRSVGSISKLLRRQACPERLYRSQGTSTVLILWYGVGEFFLRHGSNTDHHSIFSSVCGCLAGKAP